MTRTRLFLVLVLAGTLAGLVFAQANTSHLVTASEVMATLNPARPGYGLDRYSDKPADQAMAYGRYASAAALLHDEKQARIAADWLVGSSLPGWGLPFAYDAFSDGSTNPASTVYAITTADAVRGLLDTFDLTGDVQYRDTALAALDYYRHYFIETTDGGYFWYSNQPADRIDTFNVSAMLAGQYARAGVQFERPHYVALAKSALMHIWGHRKTSALGMYWPYSADNPIPNGAVHAAFIVQGFTDFDKVAGPLFDTTKAIRYLTGFASSDRVLTYRPHDQLSPRLRDRPAVLWDVGMLIYTLSDVGETDAAKKIAQQVDRYRHKDDAGFGSSPGASDNWTRMVSYLALASPSLRANWLSTKPTSTPSPLRIGRQA